MEGTRSEGDSLRSRLEPLFSGVEVKGKELIARKMGPELRTDPWTALGSLQQDLSLPMPTANAALQLLSILSISPAEAHASLFQVLKEQVKTVLSNLSTEQCSALLKGVFPLLQFKETMDIPLTVIRRLPEVPPPVVKILANLNLLDVSGIWEVIDAYTRIKLDVKTGYATLNSTSIMDCQARVISSGAKGDFSR